MCQIVGNVIYNNKCRGCIFSLYFRLHWKYYPYMHFMEETRTRLGRMMIAELIVPGRRETSRLYRKFMILSY